MNMNPEDTKMMSIKDVCEYLNISRQTLHRVTKEGELPYYRIKRSVRYKREEVEDYLRKQRKQ